MSNDAENFVIALKEHAPRFELDLTESVVTDLCDYFEILHSWNTRLHLVAPCSPAEFADRHILESLRAIKHISESARVIDIGSGGGLPIIPCLIARGDISATLFESSPRKAVFLREAIRKTGISRRAIVVASRFEDVPAPVANVVTCRAIERFPSQLSSIFEWSPANSRLLLFGGPSLQIELENLGLAFIANRIPESNQRFIYIVENHIVEHKS